ncbi:hypothetical protein PUNSTDRAFT_21230, partial [Punctularia strigosozonata HHB-11173 SS5]
PKDVPTAVRTLLLATKRLQDTLRLWAAGQASETAVSDVYVQIGNDFNATVNAFAEHGVDLSEIYSVPADLRLVLENCLGEEPSPEVLDTYMPDIRRILYALLEGIQRKQ